MWVSRRGQVRDDCLRKIGSCDGYMKAYSGNLNHYWSGLAALRMCAVAKSLADEETWEDAFDTERDAREKKDDLTRAFDDLQGAVKLAIQRARANQSVGGNDRAWADKSRAGRMVRRRQMSVGS